MQNPSQDILSYEPAALWKEFKAISDIPRCSKCEDDIIAYIRSQAEARNYEIRTDAIGNLVVVLPATPGMEKAPGLVIQGHVDMVCEQNAGTGHDFDKDPIKLVIDGEWLTADGTTLGADNGIAVAIMLTLINTDDIPHGPLELLFTIDEETGLTGALELDPAIITHKRMINVDSEEEGYFYIGCAGGIETIGSAPLEWENAPSGLEEYDLSVIGLNGGHSGADIHKQLGNSLILATRILRELPLDRVRLADVSGGDKHNAIPREAFIRLLMPSDLVDDVKALVRRMEAIFRAEFSSTEENLALRFEKSDGNPAQRVMTAAAGRRLADLMYSIPHGVQTMSRAVEGLVSTSTNFASLRIVEDSVRVLTSQRSDIKSQVDDIARRVAAPFLLAGGSVEHTREYPGWEPDPESDLLKRAVAAYRQRTGKDPVITTIHAGLECGVIGAKCGGMEMISMGPDIRGAHTPEERVHIGSTARVFAFFTEFLTAF
jgi:dipeptidase D